MKYLFVLAILALIAYFEIDALFAKDPSPAWDRRNGPEPGRPFISEMKRDCQATAAWIDQHPGASWASSAGWMFEDQCERFERGDSE